MHYISTADENKLEILLRYHANLVDKLYCSRAMSYPEVHNLKDDIEKIESKIEQLIFIKPLRS